MVGCLNIFKTRLATAAFGASCSPEYVSSVILRDRNDALKLFVVLDQGKDVEAGEFGAAFQERQFYGEG
jgi:hypothetical protein